MEYQPFDPNAKVLGRNIKALVAGTGDRILETLRRHGITDIKDDQWYPQSAVLAALKEFGETSNLVSVGTQVIKHTLFPPEVDSIDKALASIDVAYKMNHRGEVGYYHSEVRGPRHIVMKCKNPYPCDFDYGLIYGVAKRFLPAGGDLIVEHDADGTCRKKGSETCVYHVTW